MVTISVVIGSKFRLSLVKINLWDVTWLQRKLYKARTMLQLDTYYDNQAPRRIYQKKEGKQSVYDVRWTKEMLGLESVIFRFCYD